MMFLQSFRMTEAALLDQRINVDDPADCESWARYFDVSAVQLREAVRAVGTYGDEVRCFLGRQLQGVS